MTPVCSCCIAVAYDNRWLGSRFGSPMRETVWGNRVIILRPPPSPAAPAPCAVSARSSGGKLPSGRRILAICCSISSSWSAERIESRAVWQHVSISSMICSRSNSSVSSSGSLALIFLASTAICSRAALFAFMRAIFCWRKAPASTPSAENDSQLSLATFGSASSRSRSPRKPRSPASASPRMPTRLSWSGGWSTRRRSISPR
mmetsp:Transcript_8392/g.24656  ORF Transcript_8392/g.24656 Transcript_8392/m.24656 type:complete len:203 (-) Transcript_8392:280-888(-)